MWRILWICLSGMGALVMGAAGVSPQDAQSNLAAWFEAVGFGNAPQTLQSVTADNYGILIGGILVLFSGAMLVRGMIKSKKSKSPNKKTQTPNLNTGCSAPYGQLKENITARFRRWGHSTHTETYFKKWIKIVPNKHLNKTTRIRFRVFYQSVSEQNKIFDRAVSFETTEWARSDEAEYLIIDGYVLRENKIPVHRSVSFIEQQSRALKDYEFYIFKIDIFHEYGPDTIVFIYSVYPGDVGGKIHSVTKNIKCDPGDATVSDTAWDDRFGKKEDLQKL